MKLGNFFLGIILCAAILGFFAYQYETSDRKLVFAYAQVDGKLYQMKTKGDIQSIPEEMVEIATMKNADGEQIPVAKIKKAVIVVSAEKLLRDQ